jgi:hypothetical protein
MDSQADLTLRETALCYILYPKNMSRRAHTSVQVHRATSRMHEQPSDMGHDITLTTHHTMVRVGCVCVCVCVWQRTVLTLAGPDAPRSLRWLVLHELARWWQETMVSPPSEFLDVAIAAARVRSFSLPPLPPVVCYLKGVCVCVHARL